MCCREIRAKNFHEISVAPESSHYNQSIVTGLATLRSYCAISVLLLRRPLPGRPLDFYLAAPIEIPRCSFLYT